MKEAKWNFWQALFVILLIYGAEVFLGWMNPSLNVEILTGFLKYFGIGIGETLLVLLGLFLFIKIIRASFADLGLSSLKPVHLFTGLTGGIFLFAITGLLGTFIASILGTPSPQSFAMAVSGADSIWKYVFLFILGGLLAPFQEEVIFRGLIYPPLRGDYGKWKGILLTATFFAAMHFDLMRFIPLLAGGIVLTWLYEQSKSLWPAVIAHSTWNILMIILIIVQKGL
ncbi:Abortive infection protein [Syntrophobotulus glycolicus DSM 8271]|uniref:Abortive infection protein n=1 Tax=Syntrophobotulus glycolicus (strain DSM 8271 / FlGlyR) TaxID=645991 RepID=F0T0M7_SYNGF|nr:type II CAAX endopeptidase family protein [Syntrophobotulus glycolicus]ADY55092.1 Abortive infection protein [Syntrophobotulus glycolicus DSM 8271]